MCIYVPKDNEGVKERKSVRKKRTCSNSIGLKVRQIVGRHHHMVWDLSKTTKKKTQKQHRESC